MSDNKYGRVFTQADVEKMLNYAADHGYDGEGAADLAARMDADGERFKFPADEPLFILRGRDKRARGTVRYYADHQSAQAPFNHMNAVEAAYRVFDNYANDNPGEMKEPD